MSYLCFEKGCKREAKYVCLCLGPEAFYCGTHLKSHLKFPKNNHRFDSILSELSEWSKDGIIRFLTKEKQKKETLQNIASSLITKNILSKYVSDIKDINNLIAEISQASEKELSFLNRFIIQPNFDAKIAEEALPNDLNSSIKLFCSEKILRHKRLAILNKVNNDIETEKDFRKTCEFYENNTSNWLLRQTYKEYIQVYHKLASLYNIDIVKGSKSELFIYDTESEKLYSKPLKNLNNLKDPKFIIQLPNCEWLFYDDDDGDIAFIIDRNYAVRALPPANHKNFFTAIYFDRSIYWFSRDDSDKILSIIRFDLDKNRWIELASMKKYYDCGSRSLIFNRNILLSLLHNFKIFLYSIDIDSFSGIDYYFEWFDNREIFISAENRVYLIKCGGWIYESEVGNVYVWNQIATSLIRMEKIDQVFCSYNKGEIYISILYNNSREYFKFDLSEKEIFEVSYYSDELALTWLNNKLKVINCDDNTFKLNFEYINNGRTLHYIAEKLGKINSMNNKYSSPTESAYKEKGAIFHDLGQNIEAIECYSNAIKLKPKNVDSYICKGKILHESNRSLEALECFSKAIKLDPQNYLLYDNKANVLRDLGINLEAIECYNESIKLENNNTYAYYWKGVTLYDLGLNFEAKKCYSEIISLKPENSDSYYWKGVTLHDLRRNIEAKKCYKKAIKLKWNNKDAYIDKGNIFYEMHLDDKALACYKIAIRICPNDPLTFCYRANILNNFGRVKAVAQDFKRAYHLAFYFSNDKRELLKMLIKLLESAVKVKEELQKLKDASQQNEEIYMEIWEKEWIITKQCSQVIKKVVECIDWKKHKSIKEIQKAKKDVSEHQEAMINIVIKLCLLLSLQE